MTDRTTDTSLWTPRSPDETKSIYADWAATYERDVTALAYATPDRVATALRDHVSDLTTPILDVGCGTGLSGVALRKHGFHTIDGTDISPKMLEQASTKRLDGTPVYRRTWLGELDQPVTKQNHYSIIVATGVISLGAAPPSMLYELSEALDTGGILAFSYNDPTLNDPHYINALHDVLEANRAEIIFREHGPHLSAQVTGSDVILLRRT